MRPNDMVFYKANKVGEDKIEHCDHQITSDVDKFAETFAAVLSQSLKPIGAQPSPRPHFLLRPRPPDGRNPARFPQSTAGVRRPRRGDG